MPDTVLEDTDWLLLSGNSLGSLNKAPDYLNNITLLNLSSSNIEYIEEKVIKVIPKSGMRVDIRGNKLKTLPRAIASMNGSTKLWISDNPYDCNCDTLWMKNWLINNKNVQDKYNVVCSTGKMKGEIIYVDYHAIYFNVCYNYYNRRKDILKCRRYCKMMF